MIERATDSGCVGSSTSGGGSAAEALPFAELLRLIRAGDRGASDLFFQRYGDVIDRLARLQMSDPAFRRSIPPDEMAQTLFRTVFEAVLLEASTDPDHWQGWDETHVRNWLWRMARNKLCDRARKWRREQDRQRAELERRARSIGSDSSSSDPAAEEDREGARTRLVDLIQERFEPALRQPLQLNAVDGRPYGEIAAGMPEVRQATDPGNALRQRMDRAKASFRKIREVEQLRRRAFPEEDGDGC